MRAYLLASVSVLAASVAGGAKAGALDWQGTYVGIFGGYGSLHQDATETNDGGGVFNSVGTTFGLTTGGAIGGVEAGRNWRAGKFVYGIEADVGFSSIDGSVVHPTLGGDLTQAAALKALATLRARGGVTIGNTLLFGTAGVAFADLHDQAYATSDPTVIAVEKSGWRAGGVIGGGVETALTPKLSLKGEILFAGFPKVAGVNTGSSGGYGFDFKDCLVVARAGLNFHF
ncbi:MAG TPA: hypothetical protein VFB16_10690 [Bauldia sp.]|nr:hypothetical protein [Bauldia sp.]